MKKAIYAGSFDPLTNGHLWMIKKGAELFDELVVAIGTNSKKQPMFDPKIRLRMLSETTKNFKNVTVDVFENMFLANYAQNIDAQYILRGIRNSADYDYENGMRHINADLMDNISSIYLIPPRDISEVSSSLVKSLIGPKGWEDVIERYVPRVVYNSILYQFRGCHDRFKELWQRCEAANSPSDSYIKIMNAYCKKRHYHDLAHILHSLREFKEITNLTKNPDALELAIWFHDIVYDTHAKDNEEKSAKFAENLLLKGGMQKSLVNRVNELIIATNHKKKPQNVDAKLMTDIDLAIFGRSEDEFDEYERGIMREYGWVDKRLRAVTRTKILQGFLDRPHIYATEYFRAKYEKQARDNLRRSLEKLGKD